MKTRKEKMWMKSYLCRKKYDLGEVNRRLQSFDLFNL
jgi:hypothetical protein